MQSAKMKKTKLRDMKSWPEAIPQFAICILKFDLCIAFFVPTRRPGIFGSGLSGLRLYHYSYHSFNSC